MSSHPTDDTPPPPPSDSRAKHRDVRPTPRSAPAVAFLEVTENTAEVTEIPPPTRGNHLPLIIGAVVVVIAAGMFWVSRMSGTTDGGQAEALTTDSTGNMFATAAGGGLAGGGAFVRADPASMPAEAIRRFATAIARGSMDSLMAVAPGLTGAQRAAWAKEFDRAALIDAPVEIAPVTAVDNSAEVDFAITLMVLDKTTKQESTTKLSQHASLVLKDGHWQIASIR